jgi:hypothetical protein
LLLAVGLVVITDLQDTMVALEEVVVETIVVTP